jgi:EAL domain-containing protein (putative c-di-GMP-specific phosphodiesterase class I)
MDFPLAIVLQDGATIKNTPWQDIQAVFVGGSTDWKLGEEARHLIHYAKNNNLWVHVGRVNSIKRLRYCKENNVDSVDGLAFAKYNKTYVDKAIRFLEIPLENKLF